MKGISGIIAGNKAPVFHYAQRNTKFREEKVCAQTDRYLIHFDGILLNHPRPEGGNVRFDLLQQLYEQYGACMTAHLKGQYNLVIWDKQAHKVLVANDLLSRRPMYYCLRDSQLIYASSYCDLLSLLGESQGYTPCISEAAVQSMCQSGALFGDQTYLADVFYLDSYQAIVYDEARGTAEIVPIQPEKAQTAQTLDDAIRIFDRLFTAAVQAQFQKNNEYGYPHFMALSGGMDSRACLLKAIACGYDRNITCVNYSQANSIDNTVSQQIAFDHHLDYLFYPMDAAVFMTRLSDALACNECQQSSIGSTGARTIARLLDQTRMGIMHVGLCGGELMGDLITCEGGSRLERVLSRLGIANGARLQAHFSLREYRNHLRACQNFSQMFLDGCETVSPFMDEDVVQFVTGLDPQLLYRRNLYREWMKKTLPNKYPTTMFCGPIDISPARELLNKAADRVMRHIAGTTRRDMNPIDHWLRVHPHLSQACDEEFRLGMDSLRKAGLSEKLLDILQSDWALGPEQRLYTLTAITALKEVFSRFPVVRS